MKIRRYTVISWLKNEHGGVGILDRINHWPPLSLYHDVINEMTWGVDPITNALISQVYWELDELDCSTINLEVRP